MSTEKNALQSAAQQTAAPTTLVGMKPKEIEAIFMKYRERVSVVAPKDGLQADRLLMIGMQVVTSNNDLMRCSPKSIIGALVQCAVTGLNPHPQFGEVYFVPYGEAVQMQLGYRGWIKMALKAGMVKAVYAYAVYEGDRFKVSYGLSPDLLHEPGANFGDPAKVTDSYCVLVMADGSKIFTHLNKLQIERLRSKSPMQRNAINGAWKTDYDQMAKAKAIKQALKTIPMEDHWRQIMDMDEAIAPSIDNVTRENPSEWQYPDEVENISTEAKPLSDLAK